jgi:hypothetical protein
MIELGTPKYGVQGRDVPRVFAVSGSTNLRALRASPALFKNGEG